MNIISKFKSLNYPIKFLIVLVLVDQATKLLALNIFKININTPINRWMEIFPTLNTTSNPILESLYIVGFNGLALIYLIFITAMVILWRKSVTLGCTNQLFYLGLAGLLSGAISNGIDRLYLPGSIDWLIFFVSDDIALGLNVTDVAIGFGFMSVLVSVAQQAKVEYRNKSTSKLLSIT